MDLINSASTAQATAVISSTSAKYNVVYQDRNPFYNPLESTTTFTLTTSQTQNDINFSVLLWRQSAIINSTKDKIIDLRQSRPNLMLPPWVTWHRHSRLLTTQTPGKPEIENLHIFYDNKSKDTAT
jgi:hypothetical protein